MTWPHANALRDMAIDDLRVKCFALCAALWVDHDTDILKASWSRLARGILRKPGGKPSRKTAVTYMRKCVELGIFKPIEEGGMGRYTEGKWQFLPQCRKDPSATSIGSHLNGSESQPSSATFEVPSATFGVPSATPSREQGRQDSSDSSEKGKPDSEKPNGEQQQQTRAAAQRSLQKKGDEVPYDVRVMAIAHRLSQKADESDGEFIERVIDTEIEFQQRKAKAQGGTSESAVMVDELVTRLKGGK